MSELAPVIAAMRRFNRFYTRRVGFLEPTLDESPFTLTEARVLFDIGHAEPGAGEGLYASDIKTALGLDAAYLARILKRLVASGLVARHRDPGDGRRQVLTLTARGNEALARLQQAANQHMSRVVDGISADDAGRLRAALEAAEQVLGGGSPNREAATLRPHAIGDVGWVIERQSRLYAEEYGWNGGYEALVCEIGAKFLREFKPGREACWIAERGGVRLGAVFLVERSPEVGQLRMLHVEQTARGQGIGKLLVETCIDGARQAGYRQLMLWTNDVLGDARRIYEKAGFRLTEQDNHHSFGHDLVGQNWELDL